MMNNILQAHANVPSVGKVTTGQDQFGQHRGNGIGSIAFKVCSPDPNSLFICEITLHQKGGPARHLHHDQDEWFYAVEGEFILEIGQERIKLNPGDSILAPSEVPHVWAYVGDTPGRLLITFNRAGKMEAFFHEITQANARAPQEPELWRSYGMELMGPPLPIA
jgi:quercetin dioxygenase-like cupin family protein